MTEEDKLTNRRLALAHVFGSIGTFGIEAADAVKEAHVLAAYLDGEAE